jgi:hypothetical protein
MSCIYLHFFDENDMKINGCERAMMGSIVDDISLGVLSRMPRKGEELLRKWVPGMATLPLESILLRLRVGDIKLFQYKDFEFPAWEVLLSTALVYGSTPVKLATRIHAQCEVFLRVEGENRAWLAGMIEQARKDKIFRPDMGWEPAISRLRESSDDPVVMSYSVCSQFPTADLFNFKSDRTRDNWENKNAAKQWDEGLAVLRKSYPVLSPEDFETYRFGPTLMDLEELSLK